MQGKPIISSLVYSSSKVKDFSPASKMAEKGLGTDWITRLSLPFLGNWKRQKTLYFLLNFLYS